MRKERPIKEKGSKEFRDRNMHIKKLKDSGWTFSELSDKFGISVTRLHQIVEMETENEQNGFRQARKFILDKLKGERKC